MVPADVVERAQLLVAAAHDNKRFAGEIAGDVLAGLLHLVHSRHHLPCAPEYVLALQFGNARVHVPRSREGVRLLQRAPVVVGRKDVVQRRVHQQGPRLRFAQNHSRALRNKRVDGQPLACFLVPMRSPAESLEVVQATPADVGDVAPLFDAYRQFYKKPPDLEAARRFLFARLSKGESVLFLARHDARVVGFVHLYPVFSSVNLTRQWILNDLYVVAEARKLGVGRALMKRAHQLAEDTQADSLTLETAIDNYASQKLYESLGWKRDEEFYRYCLPL